MKTEGAQFEQHNSQDLSDGEVQQLLERYPQVKELDGKFFIGDSKTGKGHYFPKWAKIPHSDTGRFTEVSDHVRIEEYIENFLSKLEDGE